MTENRNGTNGSFQPITDSALYPEFGVRPEESPSEEPPQPAEPLIARVGSDILHKHPSSLERAVAKDGLTLRTENKRGARRSVLVFSGSTENMSKIEALNRLAAPNNLTSVAEFESDDEDEDEEGDEGGPGGVVASGCGKGVLNFGGGYMKGSASGKEVAGDKSSIRTESIGGNMGNDEGTGGASKDDLVGIEAKVLGLFEVPVAPERNEGNMDVMAR